MSPFLFAAAAQTPGPRLAGAQAVLRLVPVSLALLALTGCVTSGYRMAAKGTPPPESLNLTPAAGLPGATVHNVIVFQGPGSWKYRAYWDEYVVTLSNPGAIPVRIDTATLYASGDEAVAPGEDPWDLEKSSKKWWESNGLHQTGTYVALGAGTVAGGGAVIAAAQASILGGTAGGGLATAGVVGAAAFVTLPIIAAGTIAMNIHYKHKVEGEFERRRLALPLTLAPGEVVSGSLFYRITPSPRRLVILGTAGGQPRETTIDLKSLADLHLNVHQPSLPATASDR